MENLYINSAAIKAENRFENDLGFFKLKTLCGIIVLVILSCMQTQAQNAIVGTGFSSGWGGNCPSTGTGNFKYMSPVAGFSYGVTTAANATGSQYFRMGVDWSSTTTQLTITPGSDVAVAPNTAYTLNSGCTTAGAMYYSVPNASWQYVFKTRDAGVSPTGNFVFFEVQNSSVPTLTVVENNNTSFVGVASTIYATTSTGTVLPVGQSAYLRYTDNAVGFGSSTQVEMTWNALINKYQAVIPGSWNTNGKKTDYYVFTSGPSLSISSNDADLFTINLNNAGGANYNYVTNNTTNPIIVTGDNPVTSLDYSSLTLATGAFNAINTGAHKGAVKIYVRGNSTGETGVTPLNASGTGAAVYSSIVLNPIGAQTISGSAAAPLIDFNGADNVTIDGLNSGGNSLTISNTSTSSTAGTSTIRFINDATLNTITRTTILGSNTVALNSAGGTILFSTTTATTGNDGNTISSCNIGDVAGATPLQAIVSLGTPGKTNSGNTITGNNIFNYFATSSNVGINLYTGSDAFTINANKFYQTANRTTLTATSTAIKILDATGNNFAVTNNIIGYANAGGTGASTFTTTAAKFIGIDVTAGTTIASSIQNNSIAGIVLNTTSGGTNVFTGINVGGGTVNIGNVTGNIIGIPTTGPIQITSTTTAATVIGIAAAGSGNIAIANNTVQAITASGAAAIGFLFNGISVSGTAAYTITKNTIGGAAANSISLGTLGTTTAACTFVGINAAATGTLIIGGGAGLGNTIQNITINPVAANIVNGISSPGATPATTISYNSINSIAFPAVSSHTSSFVGISNGGAVTGAITISNNALGSATANLITFAAATTGGSNAIQNIGGTATSTVNIDNNTIQGLSFTSTGNIVGILNNAGYAGGNISISSNLLGTASRNFVTYSAANSTILYGILNSGGKATSALTVTGNDFTGITHSVAGSGAHYYISNTYATASQNISSNTFTNLVVNTTGSVNFITNDVALPATGSCVASSNSIVTGFSKTGAGGTVSIYNTTTSPSSATGATKTAQNNNFSNITLTGATQMDGWKDIEGAPGPAKNISNNTFTNWSCGSGAVTVIQSGYAGGTSTISTNNISTITGTGNITGINVRSTNSGTSFSVATNTINGLTSSGTGGTVIAINDISAATANTITANIISNISSTSTSLDVNAIVSGATAVTISNNTISTLTAATNTGAFRGIYLSTNAASITGNSITGMTNSSTGTSATVRAIEVAGSSNCTVSGNTISTINAATTNSTTAIAGIYFGSTGTASTITLNTISGLNATASTAISLSVAGIVTTSSSAGGTISRNKIYGFTNLTVGNGTSVYPFISGFMPAGGNWTFVNNMISLSNAANTNSMQCTGVYDGGATGTRNYWYNSIHIAGSSAGLSNSVCLQFNSGAGTANIRNNILNMTRTGGGKNYAIANLTSGLANFSSDYNILNAASAATVAASSGITDNTFAAWQTLSGGDANSYTTVAIPFINVATGDLHIQSFASGNTAPTFIESTGTILTTTKDFDNETRPGPTNANGGGTNPDLGADEVDLVPLSDISVNSLVAPISKTCYSNAEAVTIKVKNSGGSTINFATTPLTVTTNVTGAVTQTLTQTINSGTLAAGATLDVTMSTTLNMTTLGTYTFNATSSITGDAVSTNNNLSPAVTRTVSAVSAGTVTSSVASYCVTGGKPTLTVTGATGSTIQWQESTTSASGPWGNVGANSTSYTPTAAITATTYYQAVVSCGSNNATSNVVTVTLNNPTVASTTPGSVCGTGTVSLGATAGSGTLNWYAASSGGTALGTGGSFTTPSISSTTTYYVGSELLTPANVAIGSGNLTTVSTGSLADFISPFDYYYGGMKAQYLFTASELTAAGLKAGNITSLNFEVVAGGGFFAGFNLNIGATALSALTSTAVTGLTNVYSTTTPAGLTTPVSGNLNIPFSTAFVWDGTSNIVVQTCWSNANGGGTGTTVKYNTTSFVSENYFRNDNVTAGTICGTTAMDGTQSNRPKITFAGQTVCSSSPRVAVVATVNPQPSAVTIAPVGPVNTTCGTITTLTASGGTFSSTANVLNENFDAGGLPSGWVRSNIGATGISDFVSTSENGTSTGNTWTPANAGNGGTGHCMYLYTYLMNNGVKGTLETPAINLSGYSSASLSFYLYNSNGADVMKVYAKQGAGAYAQVGSTSYTTYTSWTKITISLNAYSGTGFNAVKIKFEGTSDFGASNYAIDDVLITGTGSSQSPISWSPIAGLYTDAAATIPYVANANSPIVFAKPTAATTVYTATATGTPGSCTATKTVTVNVAASGNWTGGTSTDWFTASNWCGGVVPTATTDVVIANGASNYPVINSGTALAKNISLGSTSTLDLTSTGILNIAGTVSNGGTLTNNGAIKLVGITNQTFPGTTGTGSVAAMNTLEVNNPSGVTIDKSFTITGALLPTAGNIALGANDITLASTATNTAYVGNVGGSFTYGTGKFIVERYLPARKAWRFIATPIKTGSGIKIRDTWQSATPANTGVEITGPSGAPATNGLDWPTQGYSMKVYKPTATTGYNFVSNTLNTELANDTGYMVFVRGDRTATVQSGTTASTTLRTKGELKTGNQTYTVIASPYFASIGNPYASRIDLRSLTYTNVVQSVTIWNPNLGGVYGVGAYQTYTKNAGGDFVTTTGTVNNFIESGQAFYVQSNTLPTGGVLTITELAKANGSANVSRSGGIAGLQSSIHTNLYGVATDGTKTLIDATLTDIDDNNADDIDNMDVRKIFNAGENISIVTGGKSLIVERRKFFDDGDTVHYNIGGMKQQVYELEFVPQNIVPAGLNGFLIDKFLNTSTPVSLTANTTVSFTVNATPASYAADRFNLVFKQSLVLPVTIVSVSATRNSDRSIAVKWSVENQININHYDVERSADGITFKSILTTASANTNAYTKNDLSPLVTDNFYRIKATSNSGQVQYSSVVKVNADDVKPSIRIYPNPVTDHKVQIAFTNMKAGNYRMTVENKLGQQVYTGTAAVAGSTFTQSIVLDRNIAAGTYQIRIIGDDGKQIVEHVIVQ